MADGDLCQLEDVKTWLGSTAQAAEPLLARLITAASTTICNYCGRGGFLSQGYVDLYDGNGQPWMLLRQWPVSAVATIEIDEGRARRTLADPSLIVLERPLPSGGNQRLTLRGERFPRGRSNVTVTYTAGYDEVPGDVAQACVEAVGEAYRRRERVGQVSVSMKDQSVVSFSQADLNATIKTMLSSYRRLIPC